VVDSPPGVRDGAASHAAEVSTLRLLLIGVAVSVVVSVIVTLAVADTRGRVPVPGWFSILLASAFAALVVVGAAAPWLRARALRCGAAVGVALFFAALVLFAPASGALGGTGSNGTLPWALTAFGGIVVAAVVTGGARLGWSLIVAWIVIVAWFRLLLGGYSLIGLANDAQALTTAATLCVIAVHAVRASRELDAAASRAETIGAEQGAAHGRLAARARVAAFVHDEVLAALRGAAGGAPEQADAVRAQARRATAVVGADRGASDWVEKLRAMADAAGAELRIDRAPRAVVPSALAVEALLIAARQALDNSVRHAGPCDRRILLEMDESGVSFVVVDDGVGFSPESVPPGRLGIAASIEGAMRDVAGGTARVTASPGRGVRVELRWDDTPQIEGDFVERPPLPPRRGARADVVVAGTLFVVAQSLVAGVASAAGPGSGAVPLLVLGGILVSAALTIPALPIRGPLSLRQRGALAVLLVCIAVLGGLWGTPAPLTYGSAWFVPAAGFVLVAVALNARPVLAISGLALLLVMLVVDAVVRGGDPVQLVSIVVRTATIVGLGTLLSVAIVRMRRSTRDYARRAVRIVEQREWDAAARRELEDHTAALDELAGPFLLRVAAGEQLHADDRAHARAIEGRLRDGYRAGRLLHEPLIEAAMRARTRGVDVVLLDDSGEGGVEPALTTEIAAWMTERLDAADERFVGRLLPPGRPFAAQVVVDGRALTFAR
jgi:signal transduction histidine kinase